MVHNIGDKASKHITYAHSGAELIKLQSLPFEAKVTLTNARIRQFYSLMAGKTYVSFSGGKDSTVLLDMARAIFPEMPAVFCDTGLEFPEIREFVKSKENVEIIRPEVNFKIIIETYGYPVISKEVAKALDQVRRGCKGKRKHFDGTKTGRYDYRRYSYLLEAPFKISPICCDIMKKRPFKKYGKRTGLRPFIGMLAEESTLRTTQWQLHGCINSTPGIESANPLSFWHESDIWTYIKRHDLAIAKPYTMGYKRTGCVFCMFGAQCESYPNRFQRLQRTHPKLYAYCMSERGLNMRPVCEFIHIESVDMNARLEDFAEVA